MIPEVFASISEVIFCLSLMRRPKAGLKYWSWNKLIKHKNINTA